MYKSVMLNKMAFPLGQATELLDEEQFEYAIYLHTNDIEEAEDKGQIAKAEAYLQRATCYYKMHKYQDAINDIESAIALDRYNTGPYRKLAKCYEIAGNITLAKQAMINLLNIEEDEQGKDFARIEKKKYEEIESYETKAKDAFKKENYARVVELMNDCLKKSEICIRHKILKAKCLIYIQKFEEALTVINEVLFANKDDFEAIYIRGLNLIYQEKYKLGVEDLRQTIYDCPEGKEYYEKYKDVEQCLSDAYEKKRVNLANAKELFSVILNMDPRNLLQRKSMYKEITKVEVQQKKHADALITITNALLIDEKDIVSLRIRAQIFCELKEFKDGVDDYITITRIDNSNEHQEWLKKAQKKSSENPVDHYEVLGIKKKCTRKEVEKAWKNMARNYHPDKLQRKSKAEQVIGTKKFNRIKESYELLLTKV